MKVSDELTSLHVGIDSIDMQQYLSANANPAPQQPLGSVVAGVKGTYSHAQNLQECDVRSVSHCLCTSQLITQL